MYGRTAMANEIAWLGRDTIAGLCGSSRYSEVECYLANWRDWVLGQPALEKWDDWQQCHAEFRRWYEGDRIMDGLGGGCGTGKCPPCQGRGHTVHGGVPAGTAPIRCRCYRCDGTGRGPLC